jgi:hypothetical protein
MGASFRVRATVVATCDIVLTSRRGELRWPPPCRPGSWPPSSATASSGSGRHEERIARFLDREEDVLGYPVRVVENTARAGDVLLMHPPTMHTRPTKAGRLPRFLLNKDLCPPGGPSTTAT